MSSGRRSPPQNAGNHSLAIVEPFYTNEDVALLHDIVVLAEELLPSLPEGERLPTNALFDAYYDILPRTGLKADHDNRYARVLFKIGGVRGDGTLYEKFEEVLSRMGIEIEFDEAEPDSDSQQERGQAALEDTEASIMLQDENIPPRGRARRNSDSAWDLGVESPSKQRQRRNSYSPRNEAKAPPIQDRDGFLRELFQQEPSEKLSRGDRDIPGSNVGAWLNAKPAPHRKDRGRSISTQAGMRIRRRSLSVAIRRPALTTTTASPNSDEYHAESEITAVTSAHEPELTESINFPPKQTLSKPSTSLMQIKAEVILRHHLSFLAKRQLRIWREQALQRRETNANLDWIAFQHDKNALLNQAVDTWHSRYLEKRSIAETERFFAHLERRSARARDLYLLHKSFTHWHGSACEEAERTQAARRHILRTRFFDAWRDITAVKELKVRRQVLKKFFSVWQRKHIVIRSNDTTAMQRFEGNMVEDIFKQWARKVWDIKASTWWAEGVKQRTLSLWKISARKAEEADSTAEEERYLQLAWNAWRIWKAKTAEHVNQVQQAAAFHQIYICVGAIRKWRGETRVIPAKKILQTEIATRILRDTFGTWLHRSRQERQAAVIDRMRILREAWTNWRHKSRLQMMCVRVDERVIWTSVFKWMLARRVSTAKHESREKLLRKTLQHWAARAQESKLERWGGEDLAQQFAIQKTEQHLMRYWLARSQNQLQLDADARDFYVSRLLQGVLSKWSGKHPHLSQLQQWSRDAEFYFLTSKTLKRWKVSTESSKREKRKAAYAQVRRTTKMNLGRKILHGWRSKARQILDMQAQAQDMNQNKNFIIGMNIFDRWRARTEELEDVKSKCRERVLRKFFETWRGRSIAFQELKFEAIISFQERQESRAIKKWKLVVLQIRGRSIQAAEVQERNAKRTFRRMFSYWHHKAAGSRPVKHLEVSEAGGPAQLGATARAETWSDFGDDEGEWARGHEEPVASTPLPGYLSTPSRRTERVVAAAARFSSTTPKAPLSTPFERHLRAQYSGGMPSLRRPLGRSTLGLGGGFPDITDRSTNDDRRDT
jgi:protein SFI1